MSQQLFKKDLVQAIQSNTPPPCFVQVYPGMDNASYFESQLLNLETARDTARNMELSEYVEFGACLLPYWNANATVKEIKELTGLTKNTQRAARKAYLALKDYAMHIYKLKETSLKMLYRMTDRQIAACLPKQEPEQKQEQEPERDINYIGTKTFKDGETIIVRKNTAHQPDVDDALPDFHSDIIEYNTAAAADSLINLATESAVPLIDPYGDAHGSEIYYNPYLSYEHSGPSTDDMWPVSDVRYYPY